MRKINDTRRPIRDVDSGGPRLLLAPLLNTSTPGVQQRLLTCKEAGVVLGFSEDAIRKKVLKRELPIVRLDRSKSVRLDIEDLKKIIVEKKEPAV